PRSTQLNQTLAPASSFTLPTSVAFGATQLFGSACTRCSPRRYFTVRFSLLLSAAQGDEGFRRLAHVDARVVEQVDQLDHHDRGQPPDLEIAIAVAGHVPGHAPIVDAMRGFRRVLQEELQLYLEDG